MNYIKLCLFIEIKRDSETRPLHRFYKIRIISHLSKIDVGYGMIVVYMRHLKRLAGNIVINDSIQITIIE